MKNKNNILRRKNFLNALGYTNIGDRGSRRKTFFTKFLPKLFDETQNRTFEEIADSSDNLKGEGVKIIIPSNVIDIYTRLEFLL